MASELDKQHDMTPETTQPALDARHSNATHKANSSEKSTDQTKVLFVNRSYWPDMEATGQLLTELCQSLARDKNFDVSVLCGHPNFVAEGAEYQARGNEVRKNVTIRRTSHTRYDKSTFLGRVTNFITFLIASTWRAMFSPRPDIIVVETDPPLLCLMGYVVAKLRGAKLVCYLQDVYPDIAIELGRLKYNWFSRLLRWSFLFVYRRSDRVVVVGTDMRNWLINHLVKPEKIHIIENWVDPTKVFPVKENNKFRHKFDLEDKFVAMYSGNLGFTQRFDLVLSAAEQLQHNRDIVFVMIGNGVKRAYLSEEIIKRGLPNVRLIDYQPKSELAQSLSAADAHFVLLDSKLTQLMMPSKIYSALASGTPIVGIGKQKTAQGDEELASHLAKMIDDAEAGFFVDETQPEQIAQHVQWLYDNPAEAQKMGFNARTAAEERYTRDVSVSQFHQLLFQLGNNRSGVSHVTPSDTSKVSVSEFVEESNELSGSVVAP